MMYCSCYPTLCPILQLATAVCLTVWQGNGILRGMAANKRKPSGCAGVYVRSPPRAAYLAPQPHVGGVSVAPCEQ